MAGGVEEKTNVVKLSHLFSYPEFIFACVVYSRSFPVRHSITGEFHQENECTAFKYKNSRACVGHVLKAALQIRWVVIDTQQRRMVQLITLPPTSSVLQGVTEGLQDVREREREREDSTKWTSEEES